MTRARNLSKLGNPNTFTVDGSNNVGLNSTSPDAKLDVIGVVSATSFYGDGANLTGIANTTFINSEQINVSGFVTATTFVGALTGNADTATNASGLTGTPDITVRNVTGVGATFSGDVNISGTLNYEDVTNIDSIGIVTARTGVRVTDGGLIVTAGIATLGAGLTMGDNDKAFFGNDGELQIFSSGTNPTIDAISGDLLIRNLGTTGDIYIDAKSGERGIKVVQDGAVELYHDNSKKFETTGAGVTITGVCTATSYFDGRVPQIPQNAQASAYVLVKADAGKHINAGGNVTVNSGIFDIGDCISVFNDTTGDITITQGTSVTLRLVADTSTGSRTLANYGLAAVLCVGSNEFVVSGGGIS
jgi:hypothetical protein